MRFKASIVAIACAVGVVASNVDAFQNEPDGFHGIKWGSVIDTVEQVKALGCYTGVGDPFAYVKDSKAEFYFQCPGTKVEEVDVSGVWYHLPKDLKFSSVYIRLYPSNALQFLEALKAKYGEPTSEVSGPGKTAYTWKGPKTVIRYAFITDPFCEFSQSSPEGP